MVVTDLYLAFMEKCFVLITCNQLILLVAQTRKRGNYIANSYLFNSRYEALVKVATVIITNSTDFSV